MWLAGECVTGQASSWFVRNAPQLNFVLGRHNHHREGEYVEIRFVVTPQVLYGAQRAIARHVPWLRWGGVWVAILYPLVMIGITLAYGGTVLGALKSNWGTILTFPLLWLVGISLLQRWSAGRLWRSTPSLQGEQVYVIDPTGLRLSTPVSSATVAWNAIVRVVETSEFFLLFQSKAMALFVPKKAFASDSDIQRFRQTARDALEARAAALPIPKETITQAT